MLWFLPAVETPGPPMVGVIPEVEEVLDDTDTPHLLHQQFCLVVFHNGLEDILELHQSVGWPVLHEHLVTLTRGQHEQD